MSGGGLLYLEMEFYSAFLLNFNVLLALQPLFHLMF